MTRPGGGWIPDGRAKAIHADCEASLDALDGLAIDLYLIHAPDPRTPWRTSVRALARLAEEGLVRHVGLSNVNRPQLDEALELAPIAAVQVALSPFDDGALRGGVVERCAEAGIAVIAHSPLGGPRRAGRLGRHEAAGRNCGCPERDPVGSRTRMAARPLARRASRSPAPVARRRRARLRARQRCVSIPPSAALLAEAFDTPGPVARKRPRKRNDAEVVLVMGIPGAGKSRVAAEYVSREDFSGSTETSAEDPCGSSPSHSTRSSRRALGGSCSTTRT